MTDLISEIGFSLFCDFVFEMGQKFVSIFVDKWDEKKQKKDIEDIISKRLGTEHEEILKSAAFSRFIKSAHVRDILTDYANTKIYGTLPRDKAHVSELPIISEKRLLEHLTIQLKECFVFEIKGSVCTLPSEMELSDFIKMLYGAIIEYIDAQFPKKSKTEVYLVNRHMDENTLLIMEKMDMLARRLDSSYTFSINFREPDYSGIHAEYTKKLKGYFAKEHVYLMDKIPLDDFYVCPNLICSNKKRIDQVLRLYREEELEDRILRHFAGIDWKNIFDINNIVYIIGGAGYGKSVFLKHLIKNYQEMNIIDADQYLVIYCQLREMCVSGESTPKSMMESLQDGMIISTGMDRTQLSKELLENYLNKGRCLILLDALDEVPNEEREELHQRIITFFADQNPNNKICITSRSRGFIPDSDVYPINISSLSMEKVEEYVNKMVRIGRFSDKDKKDFLNQAEKLIRNRFLGSFLILSLLLSIYKAESELPDTKLELYQKCFDYIARKREKEKSTKFKWSLIHSLLLDNAFMELSALCSPNNSPVHREIIIEKLLEIYADEYSNRNEARNAISEFLRFCSERTEIFVPAAVEDTFKFFHRSFYEYFYSKYIVLRRPVAKEIYDELIRIDLDSEVFELVVSMLKNNDMQRCNDLIQILCDQMDQKMSTEKSFCKEFAILSIVIPGIQNKRLIRQFVTIICKHADVIAQDTGEYLNSSALVKVICQDPSLAKDVTEAYFEHSYRNIYECVDRIIRLENDFNRYYKRSNLDKEIKKLIYGFMPSMFSFYSQVLISQEENGLLNVLTKIHRYWLKKQFNDSRTGRRKLRVAKGRISQAIRALSIEEDSKLPKLDTEG